ncbi:hypothetical protein RW1_040_00450 [Rhodococcus wratislaviensis NBRC 100605]|uniref:Uncharacterized protein n=1 Tax=Rhodococcus wratislaviensis NBRC 100605 TaxID=1219028 RepID=X0PVV6_RHOWR|nr:hypothetical protein RW1_040_00450 [Rhodococcus wratislaviensis NBRC 100605]
MDFPETAQRVSHSVWQQKSSVEGFQGAFGEFPDRCRVVVNNAANFTPDAVEPAADTPKVDTGVRAPRP